jgi:hypothetical protein
MIFEMVNSLEMYIICCAVLVKIIICRLLARMTYLSDFEILDRPASIAASICNAENLDASVSAYCTENPGVWALWFTGLLLINLSGLHLLLESYYSF